jgi:hypothetical protein
MPVLDCTRESPMQHAPEQGGVTSAACCVDAIDAAGGRLAALKARASALAAERLHLEADVANRLSELKLQVFVAEVRADEAEVRAAEAAEVLADVRAALVALDRPEDRHAQAAHAA